MPSASHAWLLLPDSKLSLPHQPPDLPIKGFCRNINIKIPSPCFIPISGFPLIIGWSPTSLARQETNTLYKLVTSDLSDLSSQHFFFQHSWSNLTGLLLVAHSRDASVGMTAGAIHMGGNVFPPLSIWQAPGHSLKLCSHGTSSRMSSILSPNAWHNNYSLFFTSSTTFI